MFAIDDIVFNSQPHRTFYGAYKECIGAVQAVGGYTMGATAVKTATCKSLAEGRRSAFWCNDNPSAKTVIVARKGLDKW